MATDPVCKMNLEPAKAAAKVDYAGQTYYFCSHNCHMTFTADPQKYAVSTSGDGDSAHGGGHHHGH